MRGKGGRYAYAEFRNLRPEVVRIAVDILSNTFGRIDKDLNSGN